jgi:hypothetical protein
MDGVGGDVRIYPFSYKMGRSGRQEKQNLSLCCRGYAPNCMRQGRVEFCSPPIPSLFVMGDWPKKKKNGSLEVLRFLVCVLLCCSRERERRYHTSRDDTRTQQQNNNIYNNNSNNSTNSGCHVTEACCVSWINGLKLFKMIFHFINTNFKKYISNLFSIIA